MESTDPVHPLFRDVPPPEAKLWRYLSFAKFASLLNSSRLHFTRVDGFDDHFEGAWPKKDLEYWTNAILGPFKVLPFTEQMRGYVAASCWVESPHESAAMWRLYAPGEEGVAIATKFGNLNSLVSAAAIPPNWLAGAARVMYLDHSNKGLIENLGNDERLPNTLMPFMLKNISYEHEKEVRALIVAPLAGMPPVGPIPKEGFVTPLTGPIPKEGLDLPLNLSNFIDEIVVNPFCQAWLTDAVTGLASRYGLERKLRKSSLSPDVFYIDRRERKG